VVVGAAAVLAGSELEVAVWTFMRFGEIGTLHAMKRSRSSPGMHRSALVFILLFVFIELFPLILDVFLIVLPYLAVVQ
jgi:hypothetical protein